MTDNVSSAVRPARLAPVSAQWRNGTAMRSEAKRWSLQVPTDLSARVTRRTIQAPTYRRALSSLVTPGLSASARNRPRPSARPFR